MCFREFRHAEEVLPPLQPMYQQNCGLPTAQLAER